MATLILLGAGASFGSEPYNDALTPPLGKDLFAKLVARGGVASRIPDDLKRVFYNDFEEGMAQFALRHSRHVQAFQRELALYLESFTPSGTSHYSELLTDTANKNVIFASLNYDMMLEETATRRGFRYNYSDIREYGAVRVLKPHGSINFWPAMRGAIRGCTFSGASTVFAGPHVEVNKADVRTLCIEEDSLSPAISMYAKGKNVSVCPDAVANQQRMFSSACRRASRIIALGIRVVPEDGHIWGDIAQSSAELKYFGCEVDRDELFAWAEVNKRKNISFYPGFFQEFLAEMYGDW